MIPLILSVASSSLIFVIFKLFRHFNIDTFQAIVFNYVTAFSIGMFLYGDQWNDAYLDDSNWMLAALTAGILFICLFFLMGKSSQLNGVASTSVAVKMSMAASLLAMIVLLGAPLDFLNGSGILLAILGVFLVSYSKSAKVNSSWMLIVLFLGSGMLDFLLYFVQDTVLKELPDSIFTAVGLGTAGIFGMLILSAQWISGKRKFQWKNVVGGFVLGIPNYFSIYLLLVSYKSTGWSEITVLSITNVSVVVTSALIGFLAFREKAGIRKVMGLISAIVAITLLYLSNRP
ncbi:MAG: DMT family transporter [bacterium]|nr:DMT family transporter [bacterium]